MCDSNCINQNIFTNIQLEKLRINNISISDDVIKDINKIEISKGIWKFYDPTGISIVASGNISFKIKK